MDGEMLGRTVHNRVRSIILGRTVEETETGLTFPFSECDHGKRVKGSAWLWQTEQGVS